MKKKKKKKCFLFTTLYYTPALFLYPYVRNKLTYILLWYTGTEITPQYVIYTQ